uniref:Disease resistance protein n=1 Tax=Solanum tuberosum TaxID=4113 RepID=M1A8H4_SOLTU
MSFVLGVVFGIAFGLAIIVAFVKSENARSKQRTDLASGIAAFARRTVEDSRKIFTPEQIPFLGCFLKSAKDEVFNFSLGCIW